MSSLFAHFDILVNQMLSFSEALCHSNDQPMSHMLYKPEILKKFNS